LAALTVREERRKLLGGNIKNAKVYFSCWLGLIRAQQDKAASDVIRLRERFNELFVAKDLWIWEEVLLAVKYAPRQGKYTLHT
jgi:hypothetical protein